MDNNSASLGFGRPTPPPVRHSPWDYTQYNQIVKQIETASEVLNKMAYEISPYATERIPRRLLKHLQSAVRDLDKRAIRMLALYDAAAREMVRTGVLYDHRRDLFKSKSSAVEMVKEVRGRKRGEAKTK